MSRALNLPLTASNWKSEINKARREMDLALVIQDISLVVQVETKGGDKKSDEGKAVNQVEEGKKYFERNHGKYLKDFTFLPVLSMPSALLEVTWPKEKAANCKEYYARDSDFPAFSAWWNDLLVKAAANGCTMAGSANQAEYENLLRRLILHSSLALTSLYQQRSILVTNTHLIVLR